MVAISETGLIGAAHRVGKDIIGKYGDGGRVRQMDAVQRYWGRSGNSVGHDHHSAVGLDTLRQLGLEVLRYWEMLQKNGDAKSAPVKINSNDPFPEFLTEHYRQGNVPFLAKVQIGTSAYPAMCTVVPPRTIEVAEGGSVEMAVRQANLPSQQPDQRWDILLRIMPISLDSLLSQRHQQTLDANLLAMIVSAGGPLALDQYILGLQTTACGTKSSSPVVTAPYHGTVTAALFDDLANTNDVGASQEMGGRGRNRVVNQLREKNVGEAMHTHGLNTSASANDRLGPELRSAGAVSGMFGGVPVFEIRFSQIEAQITAIVQGGENGFKIVTPLAPDQQAQATEGMLPLALATHVVGTPQSEQRVENILGANPETPLVDLFPSAR